MNDTLTEGGTSPQMESYFQSLQKEVMQIHTIAQTARKQGHDPEDHVSIMLAANMAERVVGLISTMYPQMRESGVTDRIVELEKKYGALAWEVALCISEEVAKGRFCTFKDKKEAMEAGIRTGFAYHTVGIVSAPLEGFIELRIKKRRDGKEYLALSFAGPIRGAGGTAASFCVLLGDHMRQLMGYAPYDPSDAEISRFVTELGDYHERITNLQYNPSEEELRYLISKVAVEVDGEPSERIDVSNYKDLPRLETNKIRSGVCLVVSMLALKAPKLWKRLKLWGKDFNLDWEFLEEFLSIQKQAKAGTTAGVVDDDGPKLTPNFTYIADLVAGRPVLANPMQIGGFRLRYGRTRATGFSAAALHPATAAFLYDYIALGTQLKVERPGKAAAITFCDQIDGPIVKLRDGEVRKVSTEKEARALSPKVKELLFLGDILFSYGDFSENGHMLIPAGYCPEWFAEDLKKGIIDYFGSFNLKKAASELHIPVAAMGALLKNPLKTKVSLVAAVRISSLLKIPLHPDHLFHWNGLSIKQAIALVEGLTNAQLTTLNANEISLKGNEGIKKGLEWMGVPHRLHEDQTTIIMDTSLLKSLLLQLGLLSVAEITGTQVNDLVLPSEEAFSTRSKELGELLAQKSPKQTIDIFPLIKKWCPLPLQDLSGTFIGARMGRPEKAKQRKMTGSPHTLFPVGDEGGRLRSFQAALIAGKITADFPLFYSGTDGKESIFAVDEQGKRNELKYMTQEGQLVTEQEKDRHEKARPYTRRSIDINALFDSTKKMLKMPIYPDLIKGVRGTANKYRIPEHFAKGWLRAKHNVFVNKDGTTRYDMSEVPLTHFTPAEVGTPLPKLIEMGYTVDHLGVPLTSPEQVLELKPQDVVLPAGKSTDEPANVVLFNVGKFIDDLLVRFYKLPPYYNFKSKADLVGTLVIGLAPHISAGLIGRIVGFSKTQGCFAHPLWHAGLRRDCDGDEACVMLLLDGFLNFSSKYLPDKRGAKTMDAPLVLTTRLVPSEVDDMVHGMDVVYTYPRELYTAALEMKYPWDVKVEQLGQRLDTPGQYEGIGYTHAVTSLNQGVACSAYKTIPSMEDKLKGQMGLASRIRAVETAMVATLVIEKHFLKDTKGNLRKFSQQQFRCVGCNDKFRRPPLKGVCTSCGGKLIFTISEGSVVKYLEPSISLAETYGVSSYLKQTLELTRRRIEDYFGREPEKQLGLGKWFG